MWGAAWCNVVYFLPQVAIVLTSNQRVTPRLGLFTGSSSELALIHNNLSLSLCLCSTQWAACCPHQEDRKPPLVGAERIRPNSLTLVCYCM